MLTGFYLGLPAKVNAGFIEDGQGSSSWNVAAEEWGRVKADLDSQMSELNYLSRQAQNVMDADTGQATNAKLTELKSEIVSLKGSADQMESGSREVAAAYDTARQNIKTIAEIDEVEKKLNTLSNLSGPIGAIRKFFAKNSEADLSQELVEMNLHNGRVLNEYATTLSKAFPTSLGMAEEKPSKGIDSISRGGYTGVSSPGGSVGGSGGAGGGGGYYGGGGYSGSYGGGGAFGRTPSRFGSRKRPDIPGVSEADLIDINKYLSQFTSPSTGTGSYTRGTGFELGDYSRNFSGVSPYEKYSSDLNTGLSFYKTSPSFGGFDGGFNRSTYAPFTPSTSNFGSSNFSNYGAGGAGISSTIGSYSAGGNKAFSSDSRVAGTGLSNASARTPFVGLPGGVSGISRFAGAGSMNPGAFRGTGVAGSANALTGGLGMGAATATASPATGFGGVQTTPASQTSARPMMPGMMSPMSGAGAGGSKKDKQNREGIQSSDTNILADINAFGAQRVEDSEELETNQEPNAGFVPVR